MTTPSTDMSGSDLEKGILGKTGLASVTAYSGAVIGACLCAVGSFPLLNISDLTSIDHWSLLLATYLLGLILAVIFVNRKDLVSLPVFVSIAYVGYPLGTIFYIMGWDIENPLIPTFLRAPENRSYLLVAIIFASISYFCFLVGYQLTRKISPKRLSAQPFPEKAIKISRSKMHFVVALFAALGLMAIIYFFYKKGGVVAYFQKQAVLRSSPVGSHYLDLLTLLLPLSCILWLGLDYRRAKRNIFFVGLLILSAAYLFGLATRWNIIGYIIILGVISYQNGRFSKKTLIWLLALGIAVSVIIGSARKLSQSGQLFSARGLIVESFRDFRMSDLVFNTIAGRNSTDVDLLAWILREYSHKDLMWGQTIVDIPLMVVPRAVWPEKPTEIGVHVFQQYSGMYDQRSAWHPGFVGELYINFHTLGTVIGMLLLGTLFARIDNWRTSHTGDPTVHIFHAVFASKFVIMGTITGFMFPTIQFLLYLFPLWLAQRFIVSRKWGGASMSDRTLDK